MAHEVKGLLADVNVQGHLRYLEKVLIALGLWPVLQELELRFVTFRDLDLDRRLNDRSLWRICQEEKWVLFTHDRNDDSRDSLQSTLDDSWQPGHLPILTLSNKGRFENHRPYQYRVAEDIATILFGINQDGEYRDQPRIYIPLQWP